MSTFNGFVSEFPNIRIDFFRTLPGRPPPFACFLSHVHSDHLAGLETLKSPFVYCSPATRELLLRLEKFPHRMNLSKGILECRKQTYRHLKTLLKPIPLETPTQIELSPGNDIQVTLFDANHCVGAVMFLIEGQGKAILYTGDIRSEEWWVNALIRHPTILPYLTPRKRLDKIYLDTTFAVKDDRHRSFPSKAAGLAELLQKLEAYPPSTVFYFHSWTFGYEDVWLTLSNILKSPIHLDQYRYRLYTSVRHNNGSGLECREASILSGFKCGNTERLGIVTQDSNVRLHSCEHGSGCDIGDHVHEKDVVMIVPIITRHEGVEIGEIGAGGGQGDLDQIHELELSDPMAVTYLIQLCTKNVKDPELLRRIVTLLTSTLIAEKGRLQLGNGEQPDDRIAQLLDQDAIPLDQLPKLIADLALGNNDDKPDAKQETKSLKRSLPKSIRFPYSRHSSYDELRHLVGALRPHEVWPCTAPPVRAWTEELSMNYLFGDLCDSNGEFAYDVEMREKVHELRKRKRSQEQRRNTQPDSQNSDALDGDDSQLRLEHPGRSSDTESEDQFESAESHARPAEHAPGRNDSVDTTMRLAQSNPQHPTDDTSILEHVSDLPAIDTNKHDNLAVVLPSENDTTITAPSPSRPKTPTIKRVHTIPESSPPKSSPRISPSSTDNNHNAIHVPLSSQAQEESRILSRARPRSHQPEHPMQITSKPRSLPHPDISTAQPTYEANLINTSKSPASPPPTMPSSISPQQSQQRRHPPHDPPQTSTSKSTSPQLQQPTSAPHQAPQTSTSASTSPPQKHRQQQQPQPHTPPSPAAKERLRLREEACLKAMTGRWHEISLESVRKGRGGVSRGGYGDTEGNAEEEEEEL